jgi:hypothetical protein
MNWVKPPHFLIPSSSLSKFATRGSCSRVCFWVRKVLGAGFLGVFCSEKDTGEQRREERREAKMESCVSPAQAWISFSNFQLPFPSAVLQF